MFKDVSWEQDFPKYIYNYFVFYVHFKYRFITFYYIFLFYEILDLSFQHWYRKGVFMSGDPSAHILKLAFSGSCLARVGSSSTAQCRPSVHQLGSKHSDEASGKVSQQATAELLNTFLHESSRLITLCNELLRIISFDLYTVSMTLFDAT
jgi:hypothetical protein